MTTPQPAAPTASAGSTGTVTGSRLPLRLALSEHPGHDALDGGWWPQSRDLVAELADLVSHFPASSGRVVRALYSTPDWETAPRRIPIPGGSIKVGSFPRDDTHVIVLTTSDHALLKVLVVPSALSDADGNEAMLAASTTGNKHGAADLLRAVTDSPPVDPDGFWPAAAH